MLARPITTLKRLPSIVFLKQSYSFTTPPANLDFPTPPPHLTELLTEQDHNDASVWLARFTAPETKIPRRLVELTFSRSSGPGGQNVNKVNTKVTLRCPVNSSWIPRWAEPVLLKNPHYAPSSHSILITSTVHRSQAQNINDCLQKLHDLIVKTASTSIKTAPSTEQKKKVEDLMKRGKARWKAEKMKRSVTKQSRRGGPDWN